MGHLEERGLIKMKKLSLILILLSSAVQADDINDALYDAGQKAYTAADNYNYACKNAPPDQAAQNCSMADTLYSQARLFQALDSFYTYKQSENKK